MSRATESARPTAHFASPNGDVQWGENGLTIREHFAVLALQGFITNGNGSCVGDRVRWAVEHADALIAELAKPVKK